MAGSSSQDTVNGRQFKATQTWNVLVLHLKENANIKKRMLRKSSDHCFTGANAVDVLHQFVKNNPEQFKNSSVSRENIVRLCQSFLDMSIVRRIKESDCEKIDKFEDSSAALYVFIDDSSNAHLCQMNGRQVLREIDGDIRNSLDHISLSNENKQVFTKHSSLSLRPKRRPHFPSFVGLGSNSQQASESSFKQSDKNEGATKLQPPMKRTSTSIRKVVKRASSDPNLQQSALQASSSSENEEEEKKSKKTTLRASVRLRFSQRLSFRKKSVSLSRAAVTRDEGPCSCNLMADLTCEANLIDSPLSLSSHRIPLNDVTVSPTKRPSLNKVRRSMKRMTSTPAAVSKLVCKSHSYDIRPQGGDKEYGVVTTPMRYCALEGESRRPTKMPKKELIKETPNRLRRCRRSDYGHAFSGLARHVSARRSLRKNDRPSNTEQAYVLTNPMLVPTEGNKSGTRHKLPDAALMHLRRECVRVRLLQLLDLSFIDDVIASPVETSFDAKTNNDDGKECFDAVGASFKRDDSWASSALALLTRLPVASSVLERISKEDNRNKKMKLFQVIHGYYKDQSHPFFPASSRNLVSAVIGALETKPLDQCLEVMQLLVHLLPSRRISHLHDLVSFLRDAVSDDDVTMSNEVSNKHYVMQLFSPLIFPSPDKLSASDLSSGPAGLVRFLLEEGDKSFQLPLVVSATIRKKTQLMESGQIDSPSVVKDFNFSALISAQDFENQKLENTQKQVQDLAKFISSDSSQLSSKKRKDFLKKLQLSHPSTYATLRPVKANHMFSSESAKKFLRPPGSGTLPRRNTKSKSHSEL